MVRGLTLHKDARTHLFESEVTISKTSALTNYTIYIRRHSKSDLL